jgi:hypothetical protein
MFKQQTRMTQFTLAALAAAMLVQPVLASAGDKPADTTAKPSSFVPHPRTNHHVYGAPIEPAIVGHGKSAHHQSAPKKPSSSAAKRKRP